MQALEAWSCIIMFPPLARSLKLVVCPQIHFTLEVGKQVGGAVVVKPIMLWLDPFLRHTLTDLFVWPNRIVVPLSPDPNFDYSILEMRYMLCLQMLLQLCQLKADVVEIVHLTEVRGQHECTSCARAGMWAC